MKGIFLDFYSIFPPSFKPRGLLSPPVKVLWDISGCEDKIFNSIFISYLTWDLNSHWWIATFDPRRLVKCEIRVFLEFSRKIGFRIPIFSTVLKFRSEKALSRKTLRNTKSLHQIVLNVKGLTFLRIPSKWRFPKVSPLFWLGRLPFWLLN